MLHALSQPVPLLLAYLAGTILVFRSTLRYAYRGNTDALDVRGRIILGGAALVAAAAWPALLPFMLAAWYRSQLRRREREVQQAVGGMPGVLVRGVHSVR